jgi:hypothetical protein
MASLKAHDAGNAYAERLVWEAEIGSPTVSGGFWDSGLRLVVGGFWPARSLNRSLFFHEPAYISIEYVIAFATHNLYIVFR